MEQDSKIIHGDCVQWLHNTTEQIDLTFFDPPFNQGRFYRHFDDKQDHNSYWDWITKTLNALREKTTSGGAIYFMHREKNAEFVLRCLRESGWIFQNLIVWKKMASAVPCSNKFGKHFQIIVLATNGEKARVFNKLRIDPPPMPHHKQKRINGVYVTDVWDDIRELTSGYFAGAEPMRTDNGERFHKQQAPLALLLRIILSSSKKDDVVFDPCVGTGTTLVVAKQLNRKSIGVEIDQQNVKCVEARLNNLRASDSINKYFNYYRHTHDIETIWQSTDTTRMHKFCEQNHNDSLSIPSLL